MSKKPIDVWKHRVERFARRFDENNNIHEYINYKKYCWLIEGYKEGYNEALNNNHILHGDAAKEFMEEVIHPKPLSEKQDKFLKECVNTYKTTKSDDNDS